MIKSFLLFFVSSLVIISCAQSDSTKRISSSKVNKSSPANIQIEKPKQPTVTTQQVNNKESLLIEEVNHLHFVYEPLDITFLYPSTWQQVQEEEMLIFYDEQRTKKIILSTELFPTVDIENIINIIVPKEFKESDREEFLTGPSGFYINGKMNNLILDYYIRIVPKKGFLVLSFSYSEDVKDQMASLSKQVIDSIVYNYSVIQAQITEMSKKESTQ
jgi:hypothetical protein